ncbi:hypothetical protein [Mesorhizobium sp. A623]
MATRTRSADWKTAPTHHVEAAGTRFAYRRLGPDAGVRVVLLNHWGANLDNFDPRIVEGLSGSTGLCARLSRHRHVRRLSAAQRRRDGGRHDLHNPRFGTEVGRPDRIFARRLRKSRPPQQIASHARLLGSVLKNRLAKAALSGSARHLGKSAVRRTARTGDLK